MGNEHVFYINNDNEQFIFAYKSGQEFEIMDAVLDMVFDERTDFDWFEAAFFAFDMIDKLIEERSSRNTNLYFYQPPP